MSVGDTATYTAPWKAGQTSELSLGRNAGSNRTIEDLKAAPMCAPSRFVRSSTQCPHLGRASHTPDPRQFPSQPALLRGPICQSRYNYHREKPSLQRRGICAQPQWPPKRSLCREDLSGPYRLQPPRQTPQHRPVYYTIHPPRSLLESRSASILAEVRPSGQSSPTAY